jgi:hypothetical protein
VYLVAGDNHVEIALDRSQSNEPLDAIEVRAGSRSSAKAG